MINWHRQHGALGDVPPRLTTVYFSVYFDLYKVWQRLYVDSRFM